MTGGQLDLLDYAATQQPCPVCGHREELHYLPQFIREDGRACRAFTCWCDRGGRPRTRRKRA
jgi:DNA-directed RNA polymerase subunit M/transcription elongation factor TFIIS